MSKMAHLESELATPGVSDALCAASDVGKHPSCYSDPPTSLTPFLLDFHIQGSRREPVPPTSAESKVSPW